MIPGVLRLASLQCSACGDIANNGMTEDCVTDKEVIPVNLPSTVECLNGRTDTCRESRRKT